MTIALHECVSPSPTTSRKRSREVPSDMEGMDTAVCNTTQKCARSDFYLQRMEHRLQWALKCARDGNERMMKFYLEQAEKDALHSGTSGPAFVSWKSWIRGQMRLE